jgi:hypothetical protein
MNYPPSTPLPTRDADRIWMSREDDWLTFHQEYQPGDETVVRPGLWKLRPGRGDRPPEWVFEVPAGAVDQIAELESGAASPLEMAGLAEWVAAAAESQAPRAWTAPPPEVLEALAPAGHLTIRKNGCLRPCRWIHAPGRLALQCRLMDGEPAGLAPARAAWLTAILDEAQGAWRMVRFRPDGGSLPLLAEVDLTGAPPAWLEWLVPVAAEALRVAVTHRIELVALLTDPAISTLFETQSTPHTALP